MTAFEEAQTFTSIASPLAMVVKMAAKSGWMKIGLKHKQNCETGVEKWCGANA